MISCRIFFVLAVFITFNCKTSAQDWHLAKEKNGIKVYKSNSDTGTIRSYRVEAGIHSNEEDIVAVLLKVEQFDDWIMGIDEVTVLSRNNTDYSERIQYYSITKMPWPVWNRDMVGEIKSVKITGGGYKISNKALNKPVKIPKKTTRVTNFGENYTLKPVSSNYTHMVLEGYFDIKGNLPLWLVDLFLIEGPILTISALKEQVNP